MASLGLADVVVSLEFPPVVRCFFAVVTQFGERRFLRSLLVQEPFTFQTGTESVAVFVASSSSLCLLTLFVSTARPIFPSCLLWSLSLRSSLWPPHTSSAAHDVPIPNDLHDVPARGTRYAFQSVIGKQYVEKV